MRLNEIQELLDTKKPKILLVGDGCWDYYHYGKVTRISPEAPIPVFDHERTTMKNGMAENVSKNLLNILDPRRYADYYRCTFMVENKNRYIDIKSNQQLFRVDQKLDTTDIFLTFEKAKYILETEKLDLLVISDYNKGTLSYENIETLINIAKSKDIDIFIDTKKTDLARFEGAFIKINELEYNSSISKCSNIIVTRAENGVIYYTREQDAPYWYPVTPIEFRDVTGAGDTFLSALSIMYVLTKDMSKSIMFANKAAQVSIQHYGCYAPTLEEICA